MWLIRDCQSRIAAIGSPPPRSRWPVSRHRPIDVPWRFDMRAGLVMEGRLVTALPAAGNGHLDSLGEVLPPFGVEAQRAIVRSLARTRSAQVTSGVGERRPWLGSSVGGRHRVEDLAHALPAAHL